MTVDVNIIIGEGIVFVVMQITSAIDTGQKNRQDKMGGFGHRYTA